MPHIIIQETFSKFIGSASPKILLTGNNYVPVSEIIEELSKIDKSVYILETDNDGAISISTDGEEIKLKSFSGENDMVLH